LTTSVAPPRHGGRFCAKRGREGLLVGTSFSIEFVGAGVPDAVQETHRSAQPFVRPTIVPHGLDLHTAIGRDSRGKDPLETSVAADRASVLDEVARALDHRDVFLQKGVVTGQESVLCDGIQKSAMIAHPVKLTMMPRDPGTDGCDAFRRCEKAGMLWEC